MAHNDSQSDIEKSAQEDVRKKIELEAIITSQLISRYFSPISKDFFKTYSETGVIPNFTLHDQNLNKVLNSNFDKTAKEFSRKLRNELGRVENAQELNEIINSNLEALKVQNLTISQKSISNTTQNDLQRSVKDIILAAAAANVVLNNRQIARRARRKFNSLSSGRLKTISGTQTQQAAEGAKNEEASALNKNNAVFPAAGVNFAKSLIKKTWMTEMDNRVRPAHVVAQGQVVNFREPFKVGGELLMIPGDTSLGASLGNIIECRCAAIITIS